jgi:hypothetical protein
MQSSPCRGAAHLHRDLRELPHLSYCIASLVEVRCLVWRSVRTVLVLTGKTRAVSRIPLACIALLTIGSCTTRACPRYLARIFHKKAQTSCKSLIE